MNNSNTVVVKGSQKQPKDLFYKIPRLMISESFLNLIVVSSIYC